MGDGAPTRRDPTGPPRARPRPPGRPAPALRIRELATPLALFVLAVGVRLLRAPLVFTESGVRFATGTDELYHVRRIWFDVVRFPAHLDFDRYLDFPHGARAVWPPVFDWGLAAVSRLLVGASSQAAVERLLALAPPVLGGLVVVAVWWVGRRAFGPLAAAAAAFGVAILPAHLAYSRVGYVDHHVAVSLATTALLGAAMALLRRPSPTLRAGAGTGVAVAAVLLLWPGALLHVAVVQAVAVGWVLLAATREHAVGRARTLALSHGLAAALVAPFALGQSWSQFGAFSPLVLSSFQPTWLAAGAAAFAGAALAFARGPLGATRARRIAVATALGAAGLAAGFWLIPGLRDTLAYAAGWFGKDEAFQETVLELEPLLFPQGHLTFELAHTRFSLLFWTFPLAWLWLLRTTWREHRPDRALLLVWSLAFGAAALLQFRFVEDFAVPFALVVGAALAALFGMLGRPLRVALVVAVGVALLPAFGSTRSDAEAALRAASGGSVPLGRMARRKVVVTRAARWLAAHSPPTSGWLDPRQQPEYAVLGPWGDGHLIRYRAERPVVVDNFGVYGGRENYEASARYYATTDEEEAFAIARRLGIRYVLADRKGAGQGDRYDPNALARRMVEQLGAGATPLEHHRLVFLDDDGDLPAMEARPEPRRIALFEVVPGARLRGRAQPGERVAVDLTLAHEDGRSFAWHAEPAVAPDGAFEQRLPYPTGPVDDSQVTSRGPYRLHVGDHELTLEVDEAAVRTGAAVGVPAPPVEAPPPAA